jgi:plastocyanin
MRRRTALFLATVPFLLVLGWAAAGTALAGGGCHGEDEATATEGSSSVVRLQGCTFGPTITRVPVGTEVRWVNVAGQTHDVVGRRFEWGSEALDNGQSFTHRFATAGIYPYSCSFHPGMAGIVVVGGPTTADANDFEAAAALEPASPTRSSDGSVMPAVAVGAVGLVGGLVIGAVGMRLVSRRDEAG